MLRASLSLLAVLCIAGVVASQAGKPGPAKLAERLVVRDQHAGGSSPGLSGTTWIVETDGAWSHSYKLQTGRGSAQRLGKLTAEELGKLTAAVKTYGAATLKDAGPKVDTQTTGKKARTYYFMVSYGKNTAMLSRGTTPAEPKANTKTMEGRFAGLVGTVKDVLAKAKVDQIRTNKDKTKGDSEPGK